MTMARCRACGAKTGGEGTVCGRCRAQQTPQPVAQSASPVTAEPAAESTRVPPKMIAVVVGVILLAAGVPWLRSGQPAPTARSPLPDPFASRRASAEPVSTPATVAPTQTSDFMDARDHGAAAYADGNYASALDRYKAAIEKNPDDAESLSNLGQVLVREGKAEEALPYFDRAIAIIPQRWAYRFNRARALGIIGRTAEAVAGYRDAQGLFPDDYATAFNLGLALHKLGDEAGAVDAFRKAIDLDPNDASFRMAMGTSLEKLQRPREAAAAYEEYLRLAPSAPDAAAVRARITYLTQGPTPAQPGS